MKMREMNIARLAKPRKPKAPPPLVSQIYQLLYRYSYQISTHLITLSHLPCRIGKRDKSISGVLRNYPVPGLLWRISSLNGSSHRACVTTKPRIVLRLWLSQWIGPMCTPMKILEKSHPMRSNTNVSSNLIYLGI